MQDNFVNLRRLPRSLLKILDKIIVNRLGEIDDAIMITRDILGYVSPEKNYQLHCERQGTDYAMGLNEIPSSNVKKFMYPTSENKDLPPRAILNGEWIQCESIFNFDANILGGMGSFRLHEKKDIVVPVIQSTPKDLEFYNAYLLTTDSVFRFETQQDLPLVEISIGPQYVEHFLTKQQYGGGEYIEYHDQPHLWVPKSPNCSGHILLGRQEEERLFLTGFRIPFGHAIYLSPFTLHSDAYLVGNYLVVYTVTDHYSTVIFKDKDAQIVRLKFNNLETV